MPDLERDLDRLASKRTSLRKLDRALEDEFDEDVYDETLRAYQVTTEIGIESVADLTRLALKQDHRGRMALPQCETG